MGSSICLLVEDVLKFNCDVYCCNFVVVFRLLFLGGGTGDGSGGGGHARVGMGGGGNVGRVIFLGVFNFSVKRV